MTKFHVQRSPLTYRVPLRVCVCVFLSRTPVTWLRDNSSALPWHQVTSDGRLVLQQVELSAQGDYSCWDSRGRLLHTVRLRLGRECPPLQFLCLVLETPGQRCSWSSEEVHLISLHTDKALRFLQMSPTGSSSLTGLPFGGQGVLTVSSSTLSSEQASRLHHLLF